MQGTTATYTINNLCSGIAQGTGYFDPGSIHTANMTGLTPVTRYYYIYGSDVSHLTLPGLATLCQLSQLAGNLLIYYVKRVAPTAVTPSAKHDYGAQVFC